MPKYDYQCVACDHEFELRHSYKFTGARCIECKSEKVTKVLSAVTKVTKGKFSRDNPAPVGEEVHKAIDQGKQTLQKTKTKIKGKVYKK